MLLRRIILNFDFRILIFGSATAFSKKRPTLIEFNKSEIKNQKSKIRPEVWA